EVRRLHLPAVDRALEEGRELHPRHGDVDAEERLAGDDGPIVHAGDRRADDGELGGVLELDGREVWRGHRRGGGGELAIGDGAAGLLVEVLAAAATSIARPPAPT